MGKFSENFNKFLFGRGKRLTSYVLLGIFLFLATGASAYIYFNADKFVSLPTQDLFFDTAGKIDSEFSVDATNPESPSAATGNQSKNNTSRTNSNSSGASGTNGSGGTGSSTSATETVSAYVAFYADNQSDSDAEDAIHLSVINKILATGANPVFHAGDLMEDGTQASLDRFNNIAGGMVASRSFYGALGNNDRLVGDASTPSPLYLANFSFPGNERWYSVNTGNLHLIVLDSAFASASPTQLSWLASDLQSAASQSRITGVMYHKPEFTSSIESYLSNYGADFVVSGHIHTYTKSSSGGIYRFTLNGAGSMGYATLRVYSSYAEFREYDTNGGLVDATTIINR